MAKYAFNRALLGETAITLVKSNIPVIIDPICRCNDS